MALEIPVGYGEPGDSYELSVDQVVSVETPAPAQGSGAQPASAGTAQQTAVSLAWKNEDRASFTESDITLSVTMFREDGHPDGRLVQTIVHNFGEIRVSTSFRALVPTQESFLDWLKANGGLDVLLQQFWLQLEEQRKKAAQTLARSQRANVAAFPCAPAAPSVSASTSAARPAATPVPSAVPGHQPAPVPAAPAQTQFEFF